MDKKIIQLQLPTFSNVPGSKTKGKGNDVPGSKTKGKGNDKARSQRDRDLFGRLIVISQQRKVDFQELFTYKLASVPMALTDSHGSLLKTNKAQVMHVLEEHVSPSKDPELFAQAYVNDKENTGVFIDHMAIAQKCSSCSGINTLGHLLTCISQLVFSAFLEGSLAVLISNRYDSKLSIKAKERKQRGCLSNSPEVIVNSKDQVLPRNMKAYFANPKNKDNLNSFVFNELESLAQKVLKESQTPVLAGGFLDHKRAVSVSSGKKDLVEVFSDQQKADTRIMFQISGCIKCFGISTAIVWSPDTDVFILSAYFSCKFGIDIWFKIRIKTNTKFIPVHSIKHEIFLCVIQFHMLTGCESTSSCLKGIGKKKAFKVRKHKIKDFSKLKELGDKLELPDELNRTCELFIC